MRSTAETHHSAVTKNWTPRHQIKDDEDGVVSNDEENSMQDKDESKQDIGRHPPTKKGGGKVAAGIHKI